MNRRNRHELKGVMLARCRRRLFAVTGCILMLNVHSIACAADLPSGFIGIYHQVEGSASERCTKPDEWDDNIRITGNGMQWTDGSARITGVSGTGDTLIVKLSIRNGEEPSDPPINSAQVWHLARMKDGTTLLARSEISVGHNARPWAEIVAKCP
jgi:hypothetical protein